MRNLAFLLILLSACLFSCGGEVKPPKWEDSGSRQAAQDETELQIKYDANGGDAVMNHFDVPGDAGDHTVVRTFTPTVCGEFLMTGDGYATGTGCANDLKVTLGLDFKAKDPAGAFTRAPHELPHLGSTPPPWHAYMLRAGEAIQVTFTVHSPSPCQKLSVHFLPSFNTKFFGDDSYCRGY